MTHHYLTEENPALAGAWIVRTVAYRYQLSMRDGPELIAFHWHPEAGNIITYPHIHLSAGAQLGFAPLTRAHIPTGVVPLNEVLRFAIQDLAVRPLRSEWAAILSQTQP